VVCQIYMIALKSNVDDPLAIPSWSNSDIRVDGSSKVWPTIFLTKVVKCWVLLNAAATTVQMYGWKNFRFRGSIMNYSHLRGNIVTSVKWIKLHITWKSGDWILHKLSEMTCIVVFKSNMSDLRNSLATQHYIHHILVYKVFDLFQ
jgi:hypothetical protein